MKKKAKHKNSIKKAIDFGIDVTLLYENLKLTPTERVRQNLTMAEAADELRKAGRKKYVKS